MQESIILFFLSIENPVLDSLANFASIIGEQTFLIMIIIYILWNHSKKKGFALFSSVIIAVLSMGILKAIVRSPRPFQVLDSIKGKRLETATGYSFPSGHTTTGASFYTALALAFRKRSLSILCAILMLLVGLSRLYLGVHWPIDVAGGLLLGITVSLVGYSRLERLYEHEETCLRFSFWFGIISLAIGGIIALLLNLNTIDEVAFTDIMKTLALAGGGYLGFVLEEKKVGYVTEAPMAKKILRYLLGLAGVLIIMALKAVIPESFYALGSFFRYSLIGLWTTALFPLIGKNLHLFSGAQ